MAVRTFVYLDVYPRKDGQIIEGLTKGDFVVTEDGAAETIDTFQFIKYQTPNVGTERRDPTSVSDGERQAADPQNRLFIVYLDPYNIQFENLRYVKPIVMTFLTPTIGARDLFGVATPETLIAQMTFARHWRHSGAVWTSSLKASASTV